MTNPPITLETLPWDTIVDILHHFNEFNDLHTFIISSPVIFRLSKTYITSIYKQSFTNMHGPEALKLACTILTYQRNTTSNHHITPSSRAAIKKDLSHPLVLKPTDIPQLLRNQIFFESCSKDYMTGDYPRSQSAHILLSIIPDTIFDPDPFGPSTFTFGHTFSAELFYRVWLMSFQYSYLSIDELSRLPVLVDKYVDFRLMCHIMSENNLAYMFGCMPSRQYCGVMEGCRPNGFFTTSVCSRAAMVGGGRPKGIYEVNPPLFLKMVGLLREGTVGDAGFWVRWVRFMVDYWVMGVEELCEVYGLDRFKQ